MQVRRHVYVFACVSGSVWVIVRTCVCLCVNVSVGGWARACVLRTLVVYIARWEEPSGSLALLPLGTRWGPGTLLSAGANGSPESSPICFPPRAGWTLLWLNI